MVEKRKSGLSIIGDIPWGTHLCQFYKTKEDLLDILIPYFKAGLENNEFCMWVTSEPLTAKEARAALQKAVADLDRYIKKGQIEILDFSQWYTKTGKFDADKVLEGWVDKEQQALKNGFEGLRLTGNTFWLDKKDWQSFSNYEAVVNRVIHNYKMFAICTYSLDKCGASEILDVFSTHQFALINRNNKWITIESFENKRAEEELRESEIKFRGFVENLEGIAVRGDMEGRPEFLLGKLKDITGYSWEEFSKKGLKWFDIMHPDDKKELVEKGLEDADSGKGIDQEYRIIRKDGSIRWVSQRIAPHMKEDGTPEFLQGTIMDITECKQAEEKFKGLVENVSDWIWEVDASGKYTYASPKVKDMLGYEPEEVVGKTPFDFMPKEEAGRVGAIFGKIVEAKKPFKELENKNLHKDGHVVVLETNGVPLLDSKGQLLGYRGIDRDITERKQAEKNQALRMKILQIFHQQDSLKGICKKVISLIKEYLNCEVAALRLKEGNDYPFFVNNGFPEEFVKLENYLCVYDVKGECQKDSQGRYILECMCGIIINARFNKDKPFFTKEGSFWTNSTTDLLASTNKEDRGTTTRNVCNEYGYESVALIPIKSSGNNLGLLQINDKKRNLFSLEKIEYLEELGCLMGLAVERKRAEEELSASEKKYRLLIENSGAAVMLLDKNGVHLFLNVLAAKNLGGKPEDFVGKSIYDLFPKDVADISMERFDSIMISGIGKIFEDPISLPSGSFLWFSSNIQPIKNAEGNILGVQIISRDITERKRAEEKIENLAKFPSENPCPVLRINKDRVVLYANAAAEASLLGENVMPKIWNKIIDEVFASGKIRKEIEVKIKDKVFSWMMVPVVSAGYINVYGTDITERKKMEEELRQKLEELEIFHDAAVGRELKMVELEKEIEKLKKGRDRL